jgi:hypothetical protein
MATISLSHDDCGAFLARPAWPDRHRDEAMVHQPPHTEASLMDLVTKLPLLNDLFEEEQQVEEAAEEKHANAAAITNEAFSDPFTNTTASPSPDMDMDRNNDIETITHDEPAPCEHSSPRSLTAIVSSLPQLKALFEEDEEGGEEQERPDVTPLKADPTPYPTSHPKLSYHHHHHPNISSHRPPHHHRYRACPYPTPTIRPPSATIYPAAKSHPKSLSQTNKHINEDDETYFSCSDDDGDKDDSPRSSTVVTAGGGGGLCFQAATGCGHVTLEEWRWAACTICV